MCLVRMYALLGLCAVAALGGCGGCSQEMDHGHNSNADASGGAEDASPDQDGAAGTPDAALPFCPDAGPPADASPYDASPYDGGPYDGGPDAGPPVCRDPWDAGAE